MNFYLHILIFILILFFYIHIVHQYKRSEDLEIYEMDYSSNAHLQEVCDVKQPILFEYKSVAPNFYETVTYDDMLSDQYASYDIKVKESADYWENDTSVDYVVLPYSSGSNLMKTDSKSAYFSENNEDFVEESGLISELSENDSNFKPGLVVQTKYDIMLGSRGVCLPLRYHTNYRQFLSVNSGKIRVKMTPWKSNKYLYQNRDFETYEFRSPINVWSDGGTPSTTKSGGFLKPSKKYRNEMDKIKFLEFDVVEGSVLSIPPYWWYSIQYDNGLDTLICSFTYNSLMNSVSNIPYFVKYYIQQSNIQKRVAKVIKFEPVEEPAEDGGEDAIGV